MTFDDLKQEFDEHLIGPSMYQIVHELSNKIARKYHETIYNGGLSWDSQSIDDLCQEVVLNQLLAQKQIHYIFDNATSIESVRKLLTSQIKRALVARRKATPIDRLLRRISDLAKTGQIELVEGGIPFYRAAETQSRYIPLNASQMNACVRELSQIPRLDSRLDTGRETMIYTPERLKILLNRLFETVPAVSAKEIREILEVLLTPWTPASLIPVEKESISSDYVAEDSIEEEQMIAAARTLANSLTHKERIILILKSQKIADSVVATAVGLSRPTVADMKAAVLARVGRELILDLSEDRHERAMQYLLEECNFLTQDSNS